MIQHIQKYCTLIKTITIFALQNAITWLDTPQVWSQSLFSLFILPILAASINNVVFLKKQRRCSFTTLITMCCFPLKMKCDTYPYFKSLVVHAISAGLDYVFELDAVAFCWIKEKTKACSFHMQQPLGKHTHTTKQECQTSDKPCLCFCVDKIIFKSPHSPLGSLCGERNQFTAAKQTA